MRNRRRTTTCLLAVLAGVLAPVATPPALAATDVRLETVATGLDGATSVTAPPGDDRLFVTEQSGRVRIVEDGRLLAEPFLDLSDLTSRSGERGLLGLAFHPRYADNGRFYVNFTSSATGATRVERYTVSGDPDRADRGSRTLVLEVAQPFANHNGGMLEFGPDGMLYVGLGDGGGSGDPHENGQDRSTLLGSILRLDVNRAGGGYAVPADNPFVGRTGADEIWVYGLRNPWRFSFDEPTGRLLIGDVGQNRREEVDVLARSGQAGADLGWNTFEGSLCFDGPCDPSGKTFPAHEYGHGDGSCSVTGGSVYRGDAIPALAGRYVFGDFCGGWVRALTLDGQRVRGVETLFTGVGSILSFGRDAAGELYVATSDRVLRIAPARVAPPTWLLRDSLSGGGADHSFVFGRAGDRPLTGDWDGDGVDTPGVRRGAAWHLRDGLGAGAADHSFVFGRAGDVPVVGDWDGDGDTTVGVFRDGRWFLQDSHRGGRADRSFAYGRPGDVPIVGDWDGDGRDTVGVVRGRVWHLRDDLAEGPAQTTFVYGRVTRGDIPLSGDWDGDGDDTPGIVRGGDWHLRFELGSGPADRVFRYGRVGRGDRPVTGDWDGDVTDTVGVVRGG